MFRLTYLYIKGVNTQSYTHMITVRDGHTQWVMDIKPYLIQMFWLIPVSSWAELNWVGYGYYPNCSGRLWILSKPDLYYKK